MRSVSLEPGFTRHAEGSCLVKFGDTHVLVTASLEEGTPGFLRGSGKGWVTAEYGMLPRSTHSRMRREAAPGKQSGRTQEIQRLIGRSLRAVDGHDARSANARSSSTATCCRPMAARARRRSPAASSRCAQCVAYMKKTGMVTKPALKDHVAAISCGIVKGEALLDLDYDEDSTAETDANFVLTGAGGLGRDSGHGRRRAVQRRAIRADAARSRARASANSSRLQKRVIGG